MDEVDRAQVLEEQQRVAALSRHRLSEPVTDWPRQCIDCDAWLTAERVTAVPSARRCVECQELEERSRK